MAEAKRSDNLDYDKPLTVPGEPPSRALMMKMVGVEQCDQDVDVEQRPHQ
jgi:hypothetical protein